jgi:hypothetical protein
VQRYSLRRRVADVASTQPFLLRGVPTQPSRSAATSPSVVQVTPAGMRMHRPLAQGLRILPGLASEPFPASDKMIGRVAQLYWHREWVLRPGTQIFVLGQVRSDGQRLSLQRPGQGPHVVSTRTAVWLRRSTAMSVFGGLLLATLGGLAGATLLIVHFV